MKRKIKIKELLVLTLVIILIKPFVINAAEKMNGENLLERIQDLYMDYSTDLMTGNFNAAYGKLASFIKKKVSYENFIKANQVIMKEFILKGSQLGSLRIKGKYAAAKATTYIDFLPGKESGPVLNCKIEALVFFILEKEGWRIATGDDSDIEQFVKEHPEAADIMPPVKTRIFYKYKGYWVAFEFELDKDKKFIVPQGAL